MSSWSAPACPLFERGWIECQGFNNEEAVRLFDLALQQQLQHKQQSAIHIGASVALGPNYNDPAGLDRRQALVHAAQAVAASHEDPGSFEAGLAHCLHLRYLAVPAESEHVFSGATRALLAAHAQEADAFFMHAVALMNLRPWALWDRRDPAAVVPAGPETLEVVAVLERGLAAFPAHAGLLHLYIHAMELGPTPAGALDAANRLRHLVPDQGHLVHMPSHIDMWVGDYEAAIDANVRAVAADDRYVAQSGARINYYLGYRVHNMHFVVWAAMFAGRFSLALEYALRLEHEIDDEVIRYGSSDEPNSGRLYYEAFYPVAWHVLVRFGKWEEILQKALPTDTDLHACTIATAHYARGVASAALGRVPEAEAEMRAFDCALANPHLLGRVLHNNAMVSVATAAGEVPVHTIQGSNGASGGILHVAQSVLAGEVAFARGDTDVAFACLREAVRRDNALQYDEPHGWMMPARHALGALLLSHGQNAAEAAAVFRADLAIYPDNIWALTGLEAALAQLGTPSPEVTAARAAALSRATFDVTHACCCANRTP